MKALVLGAGLVGVTTAYELLDDGFEVTVIDREDAPAQFTSHANAGLVAPAHAYAWSSPQAPMILLRSLIRNDQALRLRPTLDPAMWRWMWKFYRQCNAEGARINTTRKAKLCNYSHDILKRTRQRTGVQYDGRDGGLIYFYRSPRTFEAAAAKADILRENGCEIRALDRDETARTDPALEPVKEQIAGALFAPNDESGDARLFTCALADWCVERGVAFRFGETLQGFRQEGDKVTHAVTDKGELEADIFVMCLGVYAPRFARELGVDLPIYPVKGYSVTIPVSEAHNPPALGTVDEENLVPYCPLGNRLRMTATAEFSGYSTAHRPSDFAHMFKVAKALFPNGGDYSRPTYWAGLRPMTPEGTPIFGRGRHRNFWYNAGQGHMGWTMCHASARITADLIAGKAPEIDLEGMLLAA